MSTTFESDWENTRLKERIEELEREIERKMSAASFVLKERDVLQAKIDELMLEYCPDEMSEKQLAKYAEHQRATTLEEALASTPKQSLTSYRNSALEEAAKRCQDDESGRDGGGYFAEIIRDMKEPE